MASTPAPRRPPAVAITADPAGPPALPPRQLLLSVWCPRPGAFAARAVLGDGTLRDFDSPFELLRFLTQPPPPEPPPPGLR